MFCKNCGTEVAEGIKFCGNCGTPVEAAPAAPQAPAQETPAQQAAPAGDPIATVKGIMHYIIGGVAVLALIFGVLNLFGLYSVSLSLGGFSQSGTVSDLYDASTALLIGNILYGLGSLAVAGIGALYFLKKQMNNDLYDKFIGKNANSILAKLVDGEGIAALVGGIGAAFGILQFFFYLIADPGYGSSVSMSIFSWLMLIVYVALFCGDLFWLGKKKK